MQAYEAAAGEIPAPFSMTVAMHYITIVRGSSRKNLAQP
jgi:hypothetical protein